MKSLKVALVLAAVLAAPLCHSAFLRGTHLALSGARRIAPPSGLTYGTNPASYPEDTAISTNSATVSGAVTSYSVDPALPTGLSLNTSTGAVTGTPTTPTAQATYVVTATGPGGNTTANLVITVTDVVTPDEVSGLTVWLKSDTGVTLNGSSQATAWADQSGNGNNFVPHTATTINATDSQYNNYPSIKDQWSSSANIVLGAYTIIIVGRVTTTNDWAWGHNQNYASDRFSAAFNNGVAVQCWRVESDGGDAELIAAPAKAAGFYNTAAPKTYSYVYSGSTSTSIMRVNGVAETISGTNHTPVNHTAKFVWLGLDPSNNSGDGTLAELIIYNQAVSSGTLDSLEAALRTKYAHY